MSAIYFDINSPICFNVTKLLRLFLDLLFYSCNFKIKLLRDFFHKLSFYSV
jgi:hypothetical protein